VDRILQAAEAPKELTLAAKASAIRRISPIRVFRGQTSAKIRGHWCTLTLMKIETRAVHAGRKPEGGSRDVVPAIHLSTTFHKADDGTLPGGYLYGRPNNPNRESLEHALASLEEGAAALAFSSGSAATLAVFQSLSPGDHVIAAEDAYYGTPILLRTVMANWGLKHTLVNMQDLAAVEHAIG